MNNEDVNVYAACDQAIHAMNVANVRDFGKLKLAKWDEIKIIRTVTAVYRSSVKRARKRYYEVAFEAYVLGCMMCGEDPKTAHIMAEKAIDEKFVDSILEQSDFLTLYRFNSEAERKAYRLAEALEVAENRNLEIDLALKAWSKQLGQYAINFTDYAMIQAFQDCGVEFVRWVSVPDERRCHECRALDGQEFRINELPVKPHLNCRCHWVPVFRIKGKD